ncbi:MAG: ARPP-1 family domain-containing protein [Gemmataceae bacterium]
MRATMFATVLALLGLAAFSTADTPSAAAKPKIKGPYTHGNLSLFLIHGPDEIKDREFVTLKEALDRKLIVVHETSNVNMLSIENTSPDVEVFVMSGDVVKGGKQDRAIAYDQIVPAKSGKMALPSFCVESGRWRKRGSESEAAFAASDSQIIGKGMKAAVNDARQQGQVWDEVKKAQDKLASNVGQTVQSAASPSSLQLALEDKKLNEKLAEYETPLADILKGQKDVIGVVAVVNGEIVGADAFCSSDLFRKLWPKLLKSACTEALAEFKKEKQFETARPEQIQAFLDEASKGQSTELPIEQNQAAHANVAQTANASAQILERPNDGDTHSAGTASPPAAAKVRILKYSNVKSLLLECQEKDKPANVLHRCYIAK